MMYRIECTFGWNSKMYFVPQVRRWWGWVYLDSNGLEMPFWKRWKRRNHIRVFTICETSEQCEIIFGKHSRKC